MAELKLFDKWSTEGVSVQDEGLVQYINLTPTIAPKTCGRNIGVQFHKTKTFIIERLINKIMIPGHKSKDHTISSGHCTGKHHQATQIVKKAFEIIEGKTKQNPVSVFVKALENCAPREEIITIEYGGARYPKAVEMAPQRRIDYALRFMTQAAYRKSFNKKAKIHEALADEILNAFALSMNSETIAKKKELERQADSSR